MKITKLKLKNFAAIKVTLFKETLEIDFTKMQNPILLFIGPIGSCKTFILSHLQPFAYVGNVDVRSGDMILPNENGLKEIHYIKDDSEYIITHHYLAKSKGHQVKSYIKKDGKELNPTGLVTTFNQIIEIEFGIDIGFLKILRLGSNVNSLIKLNYSSRKEFAVKLLQEIDDYLEDYKVAVAKARECNSELSIVTEKLKKYGNTTISEYQDKLSKIESEIKSLNNSITKIISDINFRKGKLESSINSSIEEFRINAKKTQERRNTLIRELNIISKELSNIKTIFVMPEYDYLKSYYESKLSITEKISKLAGQIETFSSLLNILRNQLTDLNNRIKSLQVSQDKKNILKDLEKAREFSKQYSSYFKNFKLTYSAEDLTADIALMQTIKDMILSIREFSANSRELFSNVKTRERLNEIIIKLKSKIMISQSNVTMIPPIECKLYKLCPCYLASIPEDDLDQKYDIIQETIKIFDIFDNIKSILKSRADFLPKINPSDIVSDILTGKMIFYDFDLQSKTVNFIKYYNRYIENEKHIEQYKAQLKLIDSDVNKSIVNQRNSLIKEISSIEIEYNECKNAKKKLMIELEKLESNIRDAEKFYRLSKEYEEKSKELSSLKESKVLDEFDEYIRINNRLIEEKKSRIKELETFQFQIKLRITEIQKLENEKRKLEEKYNEINLVKDAVSGSKGIPLLYLNSHFGRAKIRANKIISEVCGNSIQLEDIIINPNEFRIPYTKNGVLIEDVINASQGESSIISMALSFALIEEFIGSNGYNILLLDEIDGSLDHDIKSNLLKILEKTMNCEQLFMITHSSLFENYPVDVYVTIKQDIPNYYNIIGVGLDV